MSALTEAERVKPRRKLAVCANAICRLIQYWRPSCKRCRQAMEVPNAKAA